MNQFVSILHNLKVSPCDHLRHFAHMVWCLLFCIYTISRKGKFCTIFRRFIPKNYSVSPFCPKLLLHPGPFCTYVSRGCPWTRSGDHASIKVKRRHLGPRGWPLFVFSLRWIRARNLWPTDWPHFSKYSLYQVCTKKRLRMSGPWQNTNSFCNSLNLFTFVDTACVFKMMYIT